MPVPDAVLNGLDGQAVLDVAVLDVSGIVTCPAPSAVGIWTLCQGTWNSGPATTATISIRDLNNGLDGNDFALDDISFVARAQTIPPSPRAVRWNSGIPSGLGDLGGSPSGTAFGVSADGLIIVGNGCVEGLPCGVGGSPKGQGLWVT